MSGKPGIPQNESKREDDFTLGRIIDRQSFERGFRKDLRALGRLGAEALEQTQLYAEIASVKGGVRTFVSADSATRGTVRTFVENVRLIDAVAAKYGFTPIYVLQPTLHATTKPLTPYEQRLIRGIDRDPFNARLREVNRKIPAALDSALRGMAVGRFVNAAGVFANVSAHIFVDPVGHTTEDANPIIVDAMWPALSAAVRSHLPASTAR
jgi:hypothetical protein